MNETIAPVIPQDEVKGNSGLVVSCPRHALPFGVIFEEYAARRKQELKLHAREVFSCCLLADAVPGLQEWLIVRDDKYREQAQGDHNWKALSDVAVELERLTQTVISTPLPAEALITLNKLLIASDDNYCQRVQAKHSLATWPAPIDEFGRIAIEVCCQMLPDPIGNLKQWLADRDAKYRKLARAKEDPHTPPSAIDELERECSVFDRPLKRLLHKMNASAVCLSGGGIRSASFCLGVLEGLARFSVGILSPAQKRNREANHETSGLLHGLDYLSTVSGGGYLGSWLSAWAYRRWAAATPSNWKSSYGEVVKALAGDSNFTSGDPSPQPIRHLREYTSYLAPALGLSLDSWDLLAIVSRNLLINWVMLAPLLLTVVAIPQISYYVSRDLPLYVQGCEAWAMLVLVLGLFIIAADFAGHQLPSHRVGENPGPQLYLVTIRFAGPVLLADWIMVELWRSRYDRAITAESWYWTEAIVFLIAWLGFCLLAVFLYRSYRGRVLKTSQWRRVKGGRGVLRFFFMQAAGLVSALATTGLLVSLAHVLPHLVERHPWKYGFTADDRLFTMLALPLFALVPLVSTSLFAGLVGIFEQEEDREWMSRAGAIQLAIIVTWMGAHAVSLYATNTLAAIKLGVSGAILGGIGSALGWSGATSAGPRPVKAAQLGKLGSFLEDHDLLLPSLCAVALLLITLGASGVEQEIAGRLNSILYYRFGPDFCRLMSFGEVQFSKLGNACYLASHLIVLFCFFVLALLVNCAINVNLFSLHGMYRMRLMRAFLGASNTQRDLDPFTGFDPKDTPREVDLAKDGGVPLHVINTTLNLVGTRNLAWRQRKAESFTFSPLRSGCWRLAYVPTQDYAGTDGVSLATAMAISGAAFNPNMGYHSSPLVTLLMTFFNVRLGWWLPNPAREDGAHHAPISIKGADFLHMTGPTVALEPLILEAFGMTDDTYRWIELTDGGHFENLGLYEMVLRRCHNIVVVDAGADPDCQFEDLGNALRKIEIDLGIPIRFQDGIKMKKGAQPGNHYCATAMIDYGCVDDDATLPPAERASLPGRLIYIKAALTGQEPPDITQYALTHPTFPHETTANQFFNESQFESYRHLGSCEIETIVGQGVPSTPLWYGEEQLDFPADEQDDAVGTDFDSLVKVATNYGQS